MSEKDEKTMETINELIRDISKGAAFSADAMQQFVSLQAEVDGQEGTIRYLRTQLKEMEETVKTVEANYDKQCDITGDLNSQLAHYHTREHELQDRESQAEVLAMSVKYEQRRVEDHQTMVSLIFRNTLLRSQVMTPGHAGHPDQYGTVQGAEYSAKEDLEAKAE